MTPEPAPKRRIFVSYSHKDKRWRRELREFLDDLEREGDVEVWDDTHIEAGAEWRTTIADAISGAFAAVLLVSQAYLASSFIHEHELPPLLDAAEANGCRIFIVLVGACRFKENKSLSRYQVVNPDRPLNKLDGHEDEVFLTLTQEIEKWRRTLSDTSTDRHVTADAAPSLRGSPPEISGGEATTLVQQASESDRFDIYLSIPMSSVPDEYLYYRKLAMRLVSAFHSCGYRAYCGALLVHTPHQFSIARRAVKAWNILDQSRFFVMVYPSEIPSSILVEAGYALKLGIPSAYIVKKGVNLPYMLDASNKLQRVDIYDYQDLEDIEEMIRDKCDDFFADPAAEAESADGEHVVASTT